MMSLSVRLCGKLHSNCHITLPDLIVLQQCHNEYTLRPSSKVSIVYHRLTNVLKSTVQSLSWDLFSLLSVTTCKSQNLNANYVLPTSSGIGYILPTIQKCREGTIARRYWAIARLKTSWANFKLYISVSNAKMHSRSQLCSVLVTANFLFLA